MPRRKVKGSTRPKPVLPESDEGDPQSKEEKLHKLNVFLQDFDSQVIEKKKKLELILQRQLNHIEACYSQEIRSLPSKIRQMKLCEFISRGGVVDEVLNNPDLYEVDDIKKTSRSRRMYETISEDGGIENSVLRSTKKKTTVKKKARGTKNSSILANISNTMPPPSCPPSAYRNGYFTPVHSSMSAAGWDTPLITPKFDPRLPVTPAQMRDAKPGEIYMSLGGSPIRNNRGTITTVQMMLKAKEDELLEQFGRSDRVKVREVLSTLSTIIEKSKEFED